MNVDFETIKKYPVFFISLGAIAVLLLVGALLLADSKRYHSRQANELKAVMERLQQLHSRDPYPSEENVGRLSENLKDSVDLFNELNELARSGQKEETQELEASDFMQFLENSLRGLRARLQDSGIKFPEQYAFGFDKYAVGQLPASGNIPRLVQQLNIIESLCGILEDASVSEIVSITREVFELAPIPESIPDGYSQGEMFSSQQFKIIVKGRERAVMEALNMFAARPMFVVVNRIEITNSRQDYSAGAQPGTEQAKERIGSSGPRETPVILGREEIEAEMELEVYEFDPSLPFNEESGSV